MVHDAAAVCGVEGPRDVEHPADARAPSGALEAIFSRSVAPSTNFEREERLAIVLADVVDRDDVRVLEARCRVAGPRGRSRARA